MPAPPRTYFVAGGSSVRSDPKSRSAFVIRGRGHRASGRREMLPGASTMTIRRLVGHPRHAAWDRRFAVLLAGDVPAPPLRRSDPPSTTMAWPTVKRGVVGAQS